MCVWPGRRGGQEGLGKRERLVASILGLSGRPGEEGKISGSSMATEGEP